MPEGTVKWFNAEFAPEDPAALEIAAASADPALVAAVPDVLADSLIGAGLVGASVALGLGAALHTASLRRQSGRTGRRSWRMALAGAAMAVAAATGTIDVGGHQANIAAAGHQLTTDRGTLGPVD